jgi:hypothetical protein
LLATTFLAQDVVGQHQLAYITLFVNFKLDVAASTVDSSNGASLGYWGEAGGNWAFYGSGSVSGYDAASVKDSFTWRPLVNPFGITIPLAGDYPPQGGWASLSFTSESVSGPIFNQLLATQAFAPPE